MQIVRVLVVAEDEPGVNTGGFGVWKTQPNARARDPKVAFAFHLGEFITVLESTQWVGFQLEVVKAMRTQADTFDTPPLNTHDFLQDRNADIAGFRFDQSHTFEGATRTIMDYDMILFFPQISHEPTPTDPTAIKEAAAIAKFMESGRGFFCTGDHYNLGSQLAGILPRVRSMRRWWTDATNPAKPADAPLAPSGASADRHDTLVSGDDNTIVFEDQSDEVPQTIDPVMYGAGLTVRQGYPATARVPHPLLCSPMGIVDKLPDHMHEGTCEVPADLTKSFSFDDGSGPVTGREYPDYEGSPLAPEVVATGSVTAHATPYIDPLDAGFSNGQDPHYDPTNPTVFGVIGAWDGHRVGKGRVVVDSTWHHFFNINLTGDRLLENISLSAGDQQKKHGFYVANNPVTDYQLIQHYYRNIIYWLIPANRHTFIIWHQLFDLAQTSQLREELHARDFTAYDFGSYPYFGQLADSYFRGALGACTTYKIRQILYKPKIPWYEWIEEIVDPWQPIAKQTQPSESQRDQALGVAGFAPSMDAIMRVGVGAAVITAGTVLRQHGRDVELAMKRYDQVFEHAMGLYAKRLDAARAVFGRVERLVKR
ncbi:MAG: hypothetical protein QM831_18500 [Kofleriaceae bacterium]